MSYSDGFVNAYITFVILAVGCGIAGLILHMMPKSFMDKVWQKLHLDSDQHYAEVDED